MIVLRGDGNSELGYGHLFRLLAIDSLVKQTPKTFITRCDNINLIQKNCSDTLTIIEVPDSIPFEEEIQWMSQNGHLSESGGTVVLDGYHFNSVYESNLKQHHQYVVTISDEPIRQYSSHAVINHGIHQIPHQYPAVNNVQYCFGFEYLLLRSDFFHHTHQEESKKQVFVAFGGADPLNLTQQYVQWLMEILPSEFKIIAVAHGQSHHDRTQFVHGINTQRMIQVMDESYFGVVASSTMALEACARHLPILTGHYVDNQKNIYRSLVSGKFSIGLGDMQECTFKSFSDKVQQILIDKDSIQQQQQLAFKDSSEALKRVIFQ